MTYQNNGEAPDSVKFEWQVGKIKHTVVVSTDGVKIDVDHGDADSGSVGTSGVSAGGVAANGSTISHKFDVVDLGTRSTGTMKATMTNSSTSPWADGFWDETTVYEMKGELTITGTLSPKITANILSAGASGLGAALGKIAKLPFLPPNLKVLFGGAAGITAMGANVLKNQNKLTMSFSANYSATMYSGYSRDTGIDDSVLRYVRFNDNPAFVYSLPDF